MDRYSTAEPITATADADATTRRLALNKDTLRDLDLPQSDAGAVNGGWIRPPISWSCPQPPPSSSHCPVAGL